MEERRLLLAVALSLLVLTAYRLLLAPPAPPGSAGSAPAPRPSAAGSPAAAAPPLPAAATPAPAPPAATRAPLETVADARERRVEARTADLAVAFTNRGARVVSLRLAGFKDLEGHPEEMIQTVAGGPRPFDLETGDAALDARLEAALFQPTAAVLDASTRPGTLGFRFAEGDIRAEKELRFEPRGYLVEVRARVERAGRPLPVQLIWGPGLGNATEAEREVQGYQPPQAVALTPSGVERVGPEKLAAPRAIAEARWLGVESHYFAALLVPPGEAGAGQLRAVPLPGAGEGRPQHAPVAALDLPHPGGRVLVYVGPKDYPSLARLGHDLARIVPVGDWIGPIVVALMRLLRFVHTHVGNYGWSIVVLTVLINLAMSPFRHYSIANGVKMAKLAPEMKVIQDRYRGLPALDKRREQMQKEIAALYARHGMSMGGQMLVGCLPLLLTMPFLIAFYRVLQVSVELRGAPFLWLPDLSQKDPLYLTPVLMGASMFLMQRMMPTAMDPSQQRMMMIMPLVLMVMFFAAPAGLNLYWLSSNVCSIVQQAITLRIVAPPEKGRPEKRRK